MADDLKEAVGELEALCSRKEAVARLWRQEADEIGYGEPQHHPEAREYLTKADEAEHLARWIRLVLSALKAAERPQPVPGDGEGVKAADEPSGDGLDGYRAIAAANRYALNLRAGIPDRSREPGLGPPTDMAVSRVLLAERPDMDRKEADRLAVKVNDALAALGAPDLLSRLQSAEQERDEQAAIVSRIWAMFGNPSYEELAGRSIYDLIEALQARPQAGQAVGGAELIAAWTDFAPRERPRVTLWEAFQAGWAAALPSAEAAERDRDALKAERDALREGLRQIRSLKPTPIGKTGFDVGPALLLRRAQEIARDVLKSSRPAPQPTGGDHG
jgi:hypothetical protein